MVNAHILDSIKTNQKPLKPSMHGKKSLTHCKFGNRSTSNISTSNPSLNVDNTSYFLYKDQSDL